MQTREGTAERTRLRRRLLTKCTRDARLLAQPLGEITVKCDVQGCSYAGAKERFTYDGEPVGTFCDTHMEEPSTGPRQAFMRMKPKAPKTFRSRLIDVVFAVICYALYPFILVAIAIRSLARLGRA
jgi:hypothetical protein